MEEIISPLIYSPSPAQLPPPPPPQYELKKDVSGEPLPVRGNLFIEVLVPDKNNVRQKMKVQVPHLPNTNCKVCYGKGYFGFETKSQKILFCHKCYKPK
jgi:hypothetical protein